MQLHGLLEGSPLLAVCARLLSKPSPYRQYSVHRTVGAVRGWSSALFCMVMRWSVRRLYQVKSVLRKPDPRCRAWRIYLDTTSVVSRGTMACKRHACIAAITYRWSEGELSWSCGLLPGTRLSISRLTCMALFVDRADSSGRSVSSDLIIYGVGPDKIMIWDSVSSEATYAHWRELLLVIYVRLDDDCLGRRWIVVLSSMRSGYWGRDAIVLYIARSLRFCRCRWRSIGSSSWDMCLCCPGGTFTDGRRQAERPKTSPLEESMLSRFTQVNPNPNPYKLPDSHSTSLIFPHNVLSKRVS